MGKGSKFAVGLFVLGGSIAAVVLLIFLGATHLFQKGQYYVTYFDESVQGLIKDSPVKYRGVPIGRVDRIRVAPDGRLVEVVLKVESGAKLDDTIVAQYSLFVNVEKFYFTTYGPRPEAVVEIEAVMTANHLNEARKTVVLQKHYETRLPCNDTSPYSYAFCMSKGVRSIYHELVTDIQKALGQRGGDKHEGADTHRDTTR
ncbi:MAG: hypothetical protein DRH12_08010 [Deltaproteobacteria bacterium]|nr:MAG: hypothetical protein DRH12_08010 [Deltaproteobacteria bacterium]